MSKPSRPWLKYLADFLVIIVGILVAFWLNQWAQNRQEQRRFEEKLGGIKKEVAKNLRLVEDGHVYHDSLRTLIIEQPDKAILRIRPTWVTNYSWQIFQNSGLENELPYETYQALTEIYNIQSRLEQLNQSMMSLIHLSNVASGFAQVDSNTDAFKRGWISVLEDAVTIERILAEKYTQVSVLIEQLKNS